MLSRTIVVALALALAATSASAQSPADVKFPESVAVSGQSLVLNGSGTEKNAYGALFAGALYLPARQPMPDAIVDGDTPWRMVLHFVFCIDQRQIADSWRSGLRDNTPNPPRELRASFDRLAMWTSDVYDGSEVVLTYTPTIGTVVQVNGMVKGVLPGKDVADAIVMTWVGPKPVPGEDFKRAILGR
jgi:hypothetical protein